MSLLQHKADRAFCEALLAKFSVEVGRRVSEIEEQQQQLLLQMQQRGSPAVSSPLSPPPAPPNLPAGRGLLATTFFSTGDGAPPEPDPMRYAFQPRRQQLLTPGEALIKGGGPSSAGSALASPQPLKRPASSSGARSPPLVQGRPPPTPGAAEPSAAQRRPPSAPARGGGAPKAAPAGWGSRSQSPPGAAAVRALAGSVSVPTLSSGGGGAGATAGGGGIGGGGGSGGGCGGSAGGGECAVFGGAAGFASPFRPTPHRPSHSTPTAYANKPADATQPPHQSKLAPARGGVSEA